MGVNLLPDQIPRAITRSTSGAHEACEVGRLQERCRCLGIGPIHRGSRGIGHIVRCRRVAVSAIKQDVHTTLVDDLGCLDERPIGLVTVKDLGRLTDFGEAVQTDLSHDDLIVSQ